MRKKSRWPAPPPESMLESDASNSVTEGSCEIRKGAQLRTTRGSRGTRQASPHRLFFYTYRYPCWGSFPEAKERQVDIVLTQNSCSACVQSFSPRTRRSAARDANQRKISINQSVVFRRRLLKHLQPRRQFPQTRNRAGLLRTST